MKRRFHGTCVVYEFRRFCIVLPGRQLYLRGILLSYTRWCAHRQYFESRVLWAFCGILLSYTRCAHGQYFESRVLWAFSRSSSGLTDRGPPHWHYYQYGARRAQVQLAIELESASLFTIHIQVRSYYNTGKSASRHWQLTSSLGLNEEGTAVHQSPVSILSL